MNINNDDLNEHVDHLSETDRDAARFNTDAQKHAIEAIEEDELAKPQQPESKQGDKEDPIETYGL